MLRYSTVVSPSPTRNSHLGPTVHETFAPDVSSLDAVDGHGLQAGGTGRRRSSRCPCRLPRTLPSLTPAESEGRPGTGPVARVAATPSTWGTHVLFTYTMSSHTSLSASTGAQSLPQEGQLNLPAFQQQVCNHQVNSAISARIH